MNGSHSEFMDRNFPLDEPTIQNSISVDVHGLRNRAVTLLVHTLAHLLDLFLFRAEGRLARLFWGLFGLRDRVLSGMIAFARSDCVRNE